jgi:leukotriene-A4 hydrolase
MNMIRTFLLLIICTLLVQCNPREKSNIKTAQIKDTHSFSNPDEAVVKHLELDLDLDFDTRTISGTATYEIQVSNDAEKIIFDTKDLIIENVRLNLEEDAIFSIGEEEPYKGRPLIVSIHPETKFVTIDYATSPAAEGLQWLNPQQAGSDAVPFLYSQSQAILARSWIPVQDGPGIRFTYVARVKAPCGMLVLMSAENPIEKTVDGQYSFTMKQPIPAYLLAIAAGDLVYKPVDERTGVYASPNIIDKARYELGEMGEMLKVAEKLYGPYQWEKYDVLFLPPAFPFGGMENPRLTFATPTILAGDRSLTSLIAHEMAHSWSGNLVTNATWDDFWLNEGFTVYFERRIMEAMYGKPYVNMLWVLGYQDYVTEEKILLANGEPDDTKLKLNLKGRDPDDGMSDIAYEKGAMFLRNIENIVGRENFDRFLNTYFKTLKFKSVTTEDFVGYLNKNLINDDVGLQQKIAVQKWVYSPGLPKGLVPVHSKRFDAVGEVLAKWNETGEIDTKITTAWTTHEWLYFLRGLPETIDSMGLKKLDNLFHFTGSGNAEILAIWFEQCIRHNYHAIDSRLREFLVRVGRRKFLEPIYTALSKTETGKKLASDIYKTARPNYHSVSYRTIDEILDFEAR